MDAIQFTTVLGADGLIHPPDGVSLPAGEFEVSIRPIAGTHDLEARGRELAARRGLNWDTLPTDAQATLIEDVKYEARGLRPPRPGPGACKGMVLYMAPDFDAPLEDMREYME